MAKFWQKKYTSKYTGREIDAAVAKAGIVPTVTEADAGKALVVDEEGKIVAGEADETIIINFDAYTQDVTASGYKLRLMSDSVFESSNDVFAAIAQYGLQFKNGKNIKINAVGNIGDPIVAGYNMTITLDTVIQTNEGTLVICKVVIPDTRDQTYNTYIVAYKQMQSVVNDDKYYIGINFNISLS